jgi:uncharacterized RDD family membrane protein YckC
VIERDEAAWTVSAPEGIRLKLQRAGASERAAAFVIDLLLLLGVGFVLLLGLLFVRADGGWTLAVLLLAWFALRHFYFIGFEALRRGTTPGKRRLRLRVISADGGPLTIDAIVARNFMREVELFLPLLFLLGSEQLWPGHQGWAKLLAGLALLIALLFPLWNRDRLRLGDLVAGTRVIVEPRALLLRDLAIPAAVAGRIGAGLQFTREQLDVYGEYELQVLEEALRRTRDPGGMFALGEIATRIQRKIGWHPAEHGNPEPQRFLAEFYAAQRRHLEQRMLLGRRRERKVR